LGLTEYELCGVDDVLGRRSKHGIASHVVAIFGNGVEHFRDTMIL